MPRGRFGGGAVVVMVMVNGEIRRTTSRLSQAHPGRVQKLDRSPSSAGSVCQCSVVVVVVGRGTV